jgi:opacity protein-like surface antigen
MKNLLIAAASLAAIAAVVPAAAQAQAAATTTNTGAYANLNLGIGDYGSADVTAIQGRLGYRFMPYLGVEGELATGIKSDTDTIAGVRVNQKLKSEAAAYAVGFLPISPNTDILARIGYGTTKVRAKALGVSDSDSLDSVNYGVGAQHLFDGLNGVRADYTYQDFTHGQGHANVWTVGYVRKF